eukprot:Sspe_Gene.62986::Locus_35726_Transcript_1_1_Confidence_1.000_Length_1493::g.62986::m.62986
MASGPCSLMVITTRYLILSGVQACRLQDGEESRGSGWAHKVIFSTSPSISILPPIPPSPPNSLQGGPLLGNIQEKENKKRILSNSLFESSPPSSAYLLMWQKEGAVLANTSALPTDVCGGDGDNETAVKS